MLRPRWRQIIVGIICGGRFGTGGYGLWYQAEPPGISTVAR